MKMKTCLMTLGAALLFGAGAYAAGQAASDAAARDAAKTLMAAAPKDGSVATIDLSNPKLESAFMTLMKAHGLTAANRPAFFRMVERQKAAIKKLKAQNRKLPSPHLRAAYADATVPDNQFMVLDLSTTDWKNFNATAYSTIYNGMSKTLTTVDVFNDKETIANGQTETYSPTMIVTASTNTGTNTQGNVPVNALAVFSGVDASAKPYGPYYSSLTGGYFPKQIVYDKPVVTTTNKWTVICLNRSNPDKTTPMPCDYGPTQPTGWPPIKVLLPYKGAVQFFDDITLDPKTGKPPTNSTKIVFALAGVDTGGSCQLVDVGDKFFSHPNTKISGKTLSWDFEPTTANPSAPYADFGPVCWQNNEFYNLTLQMSIPVGTSGIPVVATITNAEGVTLSTSTFVTGKLQMQWGCLSENTPILMADGKSRPVQDLRMGDIVRGPHGPMRIDSRTTGWDVDFVTLTDAAGHAITVTPAHPILTARGMVAAKDVRAGDKITTDAGPGTIKAVKVLKETTAKPIYNLAVAEVNGPPPAASEHLAFYAGHILVGDNEVQRRLMKPRTLKSSEVRKSLPKEWHTDYDNWLKEQGKSEKDAKR